MIAQTTDLYQALKPCQTAFCDGCGTLHAVSSLTAYRRAGQQVLTCDACTKPVACDCCKVVVPLGCTSIDHDDAVCCHWCGRKPGFNLVNPEAQVRGFWDKQLEEYVPVLDIQAPRIVWTASGFPTAPADAYECPFEEIGDVSTHSRRAA